MADVQIRCVNKHDRNSHYEGITHLGGDGWKWTRDMVVRAIEQDLHTFFTFVNGRRSNIAVVNGPTGKYVRTHADGRWNDNLLALVECVN